MLMGKKSSGLESGYVWAPYIPITTSGVIVEYGYKNVARKEKINKIFNLGLYIKGNNFSPKKSIGSRYSTKMVNGKYYKEIKIVK